MRIVTALTIVLRFLSVLVVLQVALHAQEKDLTELSLEELINLEVTSVSKKAEKFSETAAALFVITQDDIRRSGASSLPELLRLVPGMHVAQFTSSGWAISARGFTDQFANKLLVMIDGRSVYTPLFAGVYWDVQDVLLEHIERMEVIRGPGATMWGTNAVNGVINIIRKKSADTQDGLITLSAGNQDRTIAGARYGAQLSENVFARAYAKLFNRMGFPNASGIRTSDLWEGYRIGSRVDWAVGGAHSLSLTTDVYSHINRDSSYALMLTPPYKRTYLNEESNFGGNVGAQYEYSLSPSSHFSAKIYYDRNDRLSEIMAHNTETGDIELQHRFTLGTFQEITTGIGYRFTSDVVENRSFRILFKPELIHRNTWNAFIHDEMKIVDHVFHLSLGSKFERNDYTGLEIQPNVRFTIFPVHNHTLWGSVSRAVRIPARANHFMRLLYEIIPPAPPFNVPIAIGFVGNTETKSEQLLAYELGYRMQATSSVFLDATVYYNVYSDLMEIESGAMEAETTPTPYLFFPMTFKNLMDGEVWGFEISPTWNVSERMKLTGSYSLLRMQLHSSSKDAAGESSEGDYPQQQFQVRASIDLPMDVSINFAGFYVDRIPRYDIPNYFRLDGKIIWKPVPVLQFEAAILNSLQTRHAEYASFTSARTEVPRSFYAKAIWSF